MITDTMELRPRYGEVDKMGYVYHANYVSYCHQARNELLRKAGLDEVVLEKNGLMLPVISFSIEYKKPAHFDELLVIKTRALKDFDVRFNFTFLVENQSNTTICTAESTVVFVDMKTRYPKSAPEFVRQTLLGAN